MDLYTVAGIGLLVQQIRAQICSPNAKSLRLSLKPTSQLGSMIRMRLSKKKKERKSQFDVLRIDFSQIVKRGDAKFVLSHHPTNLSPKKMNVLSTSYLISFHPSPL